MSSGPMLSSLKPSAAMDRDMASGRRTPQRLNNKSRLCRPQTRLRHLPKMTEVSRPDGWVPDVDASAEHGGT